MPPPTLSSDFSSPISVVSESLSFHASPHAFLAQRGQGQADKTVQSLPKAVAARILNRRVAILASHSQCIQVLSAGDDHDNDNRDNDRPSTASIRTTDGPLNGNTFAALPAYEQLMADFFPPPNLLLLPHQDHAARRPPWDAHIANVRNNSSPFLRSIAEEDLKQWKNGQRIDLYETMKTLSWKLLIGMFLGVGPEDKLYQSIVAWQEDLLRGQFSLFPVSIKTPFWSSPRSKGIDARKKLQKALQDFFTAAPSSPSQAASSCPFAAESMDRSEVASNVLLFTSSIAVKSLASLLTAYLLNMFLFDNESASLAEQIKHAEPNTKSAFLESILLETERLSPPIIGVMRRVQQDIVLHEPDSADTSGNPATTEALVPSGWDVWLYLAGAGRQECDYENAQQFDPQRFFNVSNASSAQTPPPPLAFGHGPKTCLGKDLVRDMVQTVAAAMMDNEIRLEGQVEAAGVLGWLGWRDITTISSEQIAKDMKQLPCQRPRDPIWLQVTRNPT